MGVDGDEEPRGPSSITHKLRAMQTPQIIVDDEAPPPQDSLVVDVLLPKDHVANFSVKVQEKPKTPENPNQDQVCIEIITNQAVFHEILSWMPAKAAIKCSSPICTWLRKIPSELSFIKEQCIRSRGQDSGLFLQHKNKGDERTPNEFEFHILPPESGSTFGIPRESLDCLPKFGRILSSSNGLLLLGNQSVNSNYIYRVCNPTTRQCARLRLPDGVKVEADDPISPLITCYPWEDGVLDKVKFPNDYTIALPLMYQLMWQEVNGILEKTYKVQLLIYSDGVWDKELCDVSIEGRIVRYDMPVGIFSAATEGLVVHYLCDSGKLGSDMCTLEPYIAAFSLSEKKLSREIKLPEEAWEKKAPQYFSKGLWLYKLKETSLCLVKWRLRSEGTIKAWVLDKYGCEGESWRLVVDTSERELFPERLVEVISVGIAGGGKGLLIATGAAEPTVSANAGCGLYVYGVEGEDRGRLDLVWNHHFSVKRVPPVDRSFNPYAAFGLQGTMAKEAGGVVFLPYANTLRPVSVKNSKTVTY